MTLLQRRTMLFAAGATLASGLVVRKLVAHGRQMPDDDGEMPRFGQVQASAPTKLPDLQWQQPDGTVRTIADYAGKGVVLNLWATWCVPCVAEMPALDAMAAAVRPDVVVLPLSSDRGGAAAVQRFYQQHGVKNLPILLDPTGAVVRALGARGIPTTLLIDAEGRERGRLEGGADWDSDKTVSMVRLLARS